MWDSKHYRISGAVAQFFDIVTKYTKQVVFQDFLVT